MPTFKEVGGKCDIGGLSLNECQRVADSVYGRESSSIEVEYSNVPFGFNNYTNKLISGDLGEISWIYEGDLKDELKVELWVVDLIQLKRN